MEIKKRGRKGIDVTCVELQWLIEDLEEKQSFSNRSALWAAVENSEWAKTRSPRPLTAQVAMMMAKKHNVLINTPVGVRGRFKGSAPIVKKKKEIVNVAADAMRKLFPLKMKTVNKAIGGSFKAAIKLKCLECSCYQSLEVRLCEVTECPLWAFRPYKQK